MMPKGNPNPLNFAVSLSHAMEQIERLCNRIRIEEDALVLEALQLNLQGWEEHRDRLIEKKRLLP